MSAEEFAMLDSFWRRLKEDRAERSNERKLAAVRARAVFRHRFDRTALWVACIALFALGFMLALAGSVHAQAAGADDAVVKWTRPAAELTLAYDPPEPIYAEVWHAVAVGCLHLTSDSIPPMAAWSFYRVDADAFTTVWTGKALSVAYTHGPSHRIWFTQSRMAKPGSIAHEMLHALLYDLGRPWVANHPGPGRDLPAKGADSVFTRCGLWPAPERYP